ncbi:MAG: cytochrome P450 [Gammaproteobacteria bacterium]|nr:cytochrome P450 [Gammaproteobacteria bacterium]
MEVIPTALVAPLFNPATFAVRGAVDSLLTEIRRDYPLAQAEVPGFDPHWIVSRHADIQEVSRQNELFHSADRSATLIPQMGEVLVQQFTGGDYNLFRSLVQLDGAEHKAHRRVLFQALASHSVAQLTESMRATARAQLATLRERGGELDWSKEIATPYPLQVVLDAIGVPRVDHPRMLRLTQWLFSWADPDLRRPGSDPSDPEQQARTWKIVLEEFDEYFSTLIEERRRTPQDDLATLIANAEIDGEPMAHSRAISYFAILSTAGHDSTAHTTATAMWVLAENPDLFAALKADAALIPNFVEEAIRWTTPVKHFVRHATADCTLAGKVIAKGDRLYLSYPSGNRDEAEFDEPFRFRLDRARNRHVGFGYGGHVCLGQHLARLEMRTLWEELLPVLEAVEMTGEGELIASEFVSGPKKVPVRCRLA